MTTAFEPIAIVGCDVLFPGVSSPSELGQTVFDKKIQIGPVPPGRWRVDADRVLLPRGQTEGPDRSRSDRGGYVTGFEARFDATRFGVPGESLAGLDPSFLWAIDLGRRALASMGRVPSGRTSAVMGLLSFPSQELARYAERVWGTGEGDPADPRNRFMSGLPALLLKKALGLTGDAFALDAACASSLYAIRLACDLLHDDQADLVLAGAVNRADDLFIHIGFTALDALSPTGQSRPFHAEADGLVPAEGAGFVALVRLSDAVAEGLPVLGVIRGVGLANDGRGRGLLAPSSSGQVRAMKAAFVGSGLSPQDIGFLECHATGTRVGDATELKSLEEAYWGTQDLPVGSVKSNFGHPITAAGMAGLTKILQSFHRDRLPPTAGIDRPSPALTEGAFRLLQDEEPFRGPRRAALSAFGFGGNDAHLLVEAPDEVRAVARPRKARGSEMSAPVAIVGVGMQAGPASSWAAVLETLTAEGAEPTPRAESVELSLSQLRFPPKDLESSLPQQKAILSALQDALSRSQVPLESTRTGVYVGMGCDPEVARWGARWRLPDADSRRDELAPALSAAAVVGTMPNMPANRVSSFLDLSGPSFTVSAEERSGLVSLRLASRALRAHEVDFAVAGAVDFSDEAVHRSATAQVLADGDLAGDGAAVLILMREEDAKQAGLPVYAKVEIQLEPTHGGKDPVREPPRPPVDDVVRPRFGRAHAAHALLEVAAQASFLGLRLDSRGRPAAGTLHPRVVAATDLIGDTEWVSLHGADEIRPAADAGQPWPLPRKPPCLLHPAHPFKEMRPTSPRPMSPSKPSAAATSPRAMPRPPALPSVLGAQQRDEHRPMLPQGHQRISAPSVEHPPAGPEPVAVSFQDEARPLVFEEDSGLSAALDAHRARIDEAHRLYLAEQGRLHNHFLALQAKAMQTLASGPESEETTPLPVFAEIESRHGRTVETSFGGGALTERPANGRAPMETRARPTIEPAFTPGPAPAVPARGGATLPPRPANPKGVRPAPAPPVQVPPKSALTPASPKVEQTNGEPHRSTVPTETTKAVRPVSQNGAAAHSKPDLRPKPSAPPTRQVPVGPTYDREGLKVHASGKISKLFGPSFRVQDDFYRQVRMPEPPLLLADRVTGLDAEVGSMSTGVIWTETDVRDDSWYLHEGRMPAGVMIEAGQADLMLISYLGCDFDNRGERIYRLLGCDLTYHAGLPMPGDTLEYEIHVDGHAQHGDVRIFFFHYDGWIRDQRRISVRGGQAGFFTDAELADSGGILWDPAVDEADPIHRHDAPRIEHIKSSFGEDDVAAFAAGEGYRCFGPEYGRLATHTRTPRISGGEMVFFDRVEALDPTGGPWGRGYLRAQRQIRADDWFFRGHFKNDPCMPGTLMFEGCLQTMAFYMAGLGFTLDKDGFRFEPVPEETYPLRCRGQVTPTSQVLTYEVFVQEVWDGPEPRLYADLLCTVDGLKAFHARRMGLRLVPDWPMDDVGAHELLRTPFASARPPAEAKDMTFSLDAMLACAWGRPTRAFGAMYERFDGARKVPRLPGPPYHFMSRVVSVPPEAMGAFEPGVDIEVEYDIPPDAWYFEDSATGTMPFSVLLEAALQPCGWLASYIGSTLQVEEDLFFRNLDGTGTVYAELGPDAGILSTSVRLERVSKTGSMIIVGFKVACRAGDALVYDMDTVFGFFPGASLEAQAGLPTKAETRELLTRDSLSPPQDLKADPWTEGAPALACHRLALLDEVTGWWPTAGQAGLGEIRCRMAVKPDQWFFAAHFFQDPVQPGSLGIEAMLSALRAAARLRLGAPLEDHRFEVQGAGVPMTWKYRGQVLPENDFVEVTLQLTRDEEDDRGRCFEARGSLWVDGKRIYEASGLLARVIPAPAASTPGSGTSTSGPVTFDPESDPWLIDHCPTWTLPAVPMMVLVDRLAEAAGGPPLRLENIRLRGWVIADRKRTLRVHREGTKLSLLDEDGSLVIEADVAPSGARPTPLASTQGRTTPPPYSSGGLFHGPAFQVMTAWTLGSEGASAELERTDGDAPPVPRGAVDPLLLDGGTHAIPHDRLDLWSETIGSDRVAYPARLDGIEFFAPPPRANTRVEVRFEGSPLGPDFPQFLLQWIADGDVWAEARLTEACFPKGPIGEAASAARRAFLSGTFVDGVGLSRLEGDTTVLDTVEVARSDWLPGTVHAVYGTSDPETIARFEHRGRIHRLHPGFINDKLPCSTDPLEVVRTGASIRVRSAGPSRLNIEPVASFWSGWFNRGPWPVEDIYYGLIQRFVRRVVIEDPAAFDTIRSRAVLFLANHQTMIESLMFSIVASAFIRRPTVTIAKAEHRDSWLGTLIKLCFEYPNVEDPGVITFFDRDDKASLPLIISQLAGQLASDEKGVMVHIEGTRALEANHDVEKMSGAFLDLAIQTATPVVPVRFVGGLPESPLNSRTDFPVGMGKQDIWLGRPFMPETLEKTPYGPRKAAVLARLNQLGGPRHGERPIEPDPAFAQKVRQRTMETGVSEAHAVIIEALLEGPEGASEPIERLVHAAREGSAPALGAKPEDLWLGRLAGRLLGEKI